MASLQTRMTDLLGIELPVIQTAMGWVATPELTAATCNAGAIGFLATANLNPNEVAAAIDRVKSLTDRPFGVNYLMEAPGADQVTETMIKAGVRVASYSRSPNAEFIARFKEAGMLCIPTVGAAKHAEKAVKLGADLVIVQGGEGGGHTGPIATSILVPQVVDAVGGEVPVVAAGGFKDGRGLVAALAWGADGIAMGTRFLMTAESPVKGDTPQRYIDASVNQIQTTTEIDGLPQRVIDNEFLGKLKQSGTIGKLLHAAECALEFQKTSGASLPDIVRSGLAMKQSQGLSWSQMIMSANAPMLTKRAMVDGNPVRGILPSGMVAGVIDDWPPVAEVVDAIRAEAEARLDALCALRGGD